MNCVSCGDPIWPLRARTQSKRSRISGSTEERRLFYAATCTAEKNSGCARARQAKDHKTLVRKIFGIGRVEAPSIRVEVHDASGQVLYRLASEVKEKISVSIPAGASTIEFLPVEI